MDNLLDETMLRYHSILVMVWLLKDYSDNSNKRMGWNYGRTMQINEEERLDGF